MTSGSAVLMIDDADTTRISYWSNDPVTSSWTHAYQPYAHNVSITSFQGKEENSSAILTFPFNGTSVQIFGIVPVNDTSPLVQCAVDGVERNFTGVTELQNQMSLNVLYCDFEDLADDEEHSLALSVASPSGTFMLDYVLYTYPMNSPLNAVPPGSLAHVVIDDAQTDIISYQAPSTGFWDSFTDQTDYYNETVHSTYTPGSIVSFAFQGSEVQIYGGLPSAVSANESDITTSGFVIYTVDDGQSNVSFNVTTGTGALTPSLIPLEQVELFGYNFGEDSNYSLTIETGQGTSGSIPYELDYIVYTASPSFGMHENDSSSSSVPVSSDGAISSSHMSTRSKVIIGVAVTAAVIVIALILLSGLIYRRQRRAKDRRSAVPQAQGGGIAINLDALRAGRRNSFDSGRSSPPLSIYKQR